MPPCQEPRSFGSYVGRGYLIKQGKRAAMRRYLRRLAPLVRPAAFNELSAEVCGPQPRPLQTREKRNICGSKNVRSDAPRDGQQPRSQNPSRHSSLESAYLAPRQGIDIIPQFVAVGSAAITIIGRQHMPLAKGTKISCSTPETICPAGAYRTGPTWNCSTDSGYRCGGTSTILPPERMFSEHAKTG